MEIILEQYKSYNIHKGHQADLSDAFDIYFSLSYQDEFPETLCPSYPENDRRNLALSIFRNCFQAAGSWFLLREEVPFLLECLNVPDDEIVHMEAKLEEYFKRFNLMRNVAI